MVRASVTRLVRVTAIQMARANARQTAKMAVMPQQEPASAPPPVRMAAIPMDLANPRYSVRMEPMQMARASVTAVAAAPVFPMVRVQCAMAR